MSFSSVTQSAEYSEPSCSTSVHSVFNAWSAKSASLSLFEIASVPMFEREARVKFFVTFECTFERWCSSNFLVLQMSDTREFCAF